MKWILLFFHLPFSTGSFNVRSTGKPPTIIPANISFVFINYQDAFIIEDFSQVSKIEFHHTNDVKTKVVSLASNDYSYPWIDENQKVVQALMEGADLLAKMDPCVNIFYKYRVSSS